MKLRSVRLRVALLTFLTAGFVLLLAGIMGAVAWYASALRQTDALLAGTAHQTLRVPSKAPPNLWFFLRARWEASEADTPVAVAARMEDRGGRSHASPNWPVALDPQVLFDAAPELPLDPTPPDLGEDESLPVSAFFYETRAAEGGEWRVLIARNERVTLAVAAPLEPVKQELWALVGRFALIFPVVMLAGAWLAALLMHRALRPVREVAETLARVSAAGLEERLEEHEVDVEFAGTIEIFNAMMDRLEASFKDARRFTADAAHELKTPLTILQGKLEQAILASEPESPDQQRYSELLDEISRLRSITEKLLLLSLSDSGRMPLQTERLDLAEMVASLCEDMEILAPDLTCQVEIESSLFIEADRGLMGQVLHNLASNAIKYNREKGSVWFDLRRQGAHACLRVSNTGKVISQEDKSQIFERFYRADKSRSRKREGVGLGLSLAREIVRAHQGELRLASSDKKRTTFELLLPLADDLTELGSVNTLSRERLRQALATANRGEETGPKPKERP
ncbi:MAG: ATP-binding protein [Sumerlaeia bacterium]